MEKSKVKAKGGKRNISENEKIEEARQNTFFKSNGFASQNQIKVLPHSG
jgi:hypothetical protein